MAGLLRNNLKNMKIIKVDEKDFTKFYKISLFLRTIFSFEPFEFIVIRQGMSKLGVGVSWCVFTNERLEDDLKLSNLPFSCKRIWFKCGLVKINEMTKYLKKSEHAELSSRKINATKDRMSMTIGHVTIIYPPLYRRKIRYSVYNEIII